MRNNSVPSRNDLKDNFYLLALEKELKFDIGKYENLLKPLKDLEKKSSDVRREIDALETVLEYAKDKYRKISDDIRIANANPKNHSYLGFTYKPKIYNIQGNVEISHDIYYEGEWFAFMPTNPMLPHSFVGQKLFRSYVKYLYKIIQKHHKEQNEEINCEK